MALNRNLPPVRADQFSMVPRADVPRSTFRTQHTYKTTLNAGPLYPVLVEEVLPGDVHRGKATFFVRMATPIFPIMDNVHCETFFFFVPSRLVWDNWVKFMGERRNPADSINYIIPVVASAAGGFPANSLYDYFGLPVAGTTNVDPAGVVEVNALPLRAYNLIYSEWFRDQNLQNYLPVNAGSDGPDSIADYQLQLRNKRHDYFTSALPWPTKNNDLPNILVGGTAPVYGVGGIGTGVAGAWTNVATGAVGTNLEPIGLGDTLANVAFSTRDAGGGTYVPNVWADLSEATGATVNSLRLAIATQQLLEKDARGGTRYTELLRMHFGVMPQDARLQRPEYIGGGKFTLQTQAIPQTSATETGSTPLGELGAASTGTDQHEFSYSATEHGYIIGLLQISADVTYQQGLHRLWTRQTRYDFYWPSFAFLGEQIVRNDELYCTGVDAIDSAAFGYQERWAEYRHRPSKITGLFRSGVSGSADNWHLSQHFTSLPALNTTFMRDTPPITRVLAAGETADNQQFLLDSVWSIAATRALPTRSVPGLTRF